MVATKILSSKAIVTYLHWAPEVVVHGVSVSVSSEHEEAWPKLQSPQALVMTVPSVETDVAHQDTGESA